jgi:xanthine/CO dehydrogenase XdhC/CoxF family maturation factor
MFAESSVFSHDTHRPSKPSLIDVTNCHAAVVMRHHLTSDAAYLRELAEAGAPAYIGLLDPAARRNRLFSALGATAAELRARLRGPERITVISAAHPFKH